MLDKLRDRATQTLAESGLCTLATTGPAGLQASMVPCASQGIILYLLVPDTSDHLFNLESEPEVAVTAENWRLRGAAEIVQDRADLFSTEKSQWHTLIRIRPIRLDIMPGGGVASHAETIDFDS